MSRKPLRLRTAALLTKALFGLLLLFAMIAPRVSPADQSNHPPTSASNPVPAANAVFSAFDKYEIVALPAAHGMKDLDDFLLDLIRDPRLSQTVNDIAVECGNSLYQPILDRYMAGEDVPFAEVRKVWRNTTQPMCGIDGFYETFFFLVRAVNQRLPAAQRMRVLACDPPIDWDRIKTSQDFQTAIMRLSRDASISSVIEKEVLSRHRKALMLFGTFHVFHVHEVRAGFFQKDYPNSTFVIAELGQFGTKLSSLSQNPFAGWPDPSVALAKGTWLGALDLAHLYPPPDLVDQDCNYHHAFPKLLQGPVENLVDAFLYLGPQDLRLGEKIPADIVLDADYMKEWQRRQALPGSVGRGFDAQAFEQEILSSAADPTFSFDASDKPADPKDIAEAVKMCREHKSPARAH
jgi:hypothetical protein